jgi:hypothetical protein
MGVLVGRGMRVGHLCHLKKAMSNEKQLVTRHTRGFPRFTKHENIDTYIVPIIYKPNFQEVYMAKCHGQLCRYQKVEIVQ